MASIQDIKTSRRESKDLKAQEKEADKQRKALDKAKKKLDKDKKKVKDKQSGGSPAHTPPMPPASSLVSLPSLDESVTTSLTRNNSAHNLSTRNPTQPLMPEVVASPPRSPSTAQIKVSLTEFKVIRLIGKGGFGEVYLTEHTPTKKKYALKVMEKRLIAETNKMQHILNERDVLVKNKSDFLVHLYYAFRDEQYLYFAMEYCPGGDLRSLLNAVGQLVEDEARLYFAEMIMAVHELHKMGYLHRDIKPDNFLIDPAGHLKLADFGLSKEGVIAPPSMKQSRMDSRKSLLLGEVDFFRLNPDNIAVKFTRTRSTGKMEPLAPLKIKLYSPLSSRTGGTIPPPGGHYKPPPTKRRQLAYSMVGSPDYMSPEVVGQAGYSQDADWWSIGCNFFEIVMGFPPFAGESPDEIFANISNFQTLLPQMLNQYKEYMSPDCFSLIVGLLSEPSTRLGVGGIGELQSHKFFTGLDWNNLRKETPPFIPNLSGDDDSSYFDANVQNKEAEHLKAISTAQHPTSAATTPPPLQTSPTIPNIDSHLRVFSFALEQASADELQRQLTAMQMQEPKPRSKRSGAVLDTSTVSPKSPRKEQPL